MTSSMFATADCETHQQMAAIASARQIMAGAAENDLLAEGDEASQRLADAHLPWPAIVERQHVDAEGRLQLGEAEELVEHHLRRRVALEFDDDAHALAIALVPHVGNTLDLLVADEIGDALQKRRPCSPDRESR